eukprot:5392504-Prymnesium_polylepis.1
MLVQRTTLSGWLLLVDRDLPLLRLALALVITVFCLTVLLLCQPYKARIDFGLAICGQFLLVCCFVGGILVKLYNDIADDPIGSAALALRFTGFSSSHDAVNLMIAVAMFEMIAFALAFLVQSYHHARKQRLEA